MPVRFPYTNSQAGIVAVVSQLRSAFPNKVNAETLEKWGIAPNNESYILNVLRFLGVIDDESNKKPEAAKVFLVHEDTRFAGQFEGLVKAAYSELFEHFGDKAWDLAKDDLITFFRASDETTATVGGRQAGTFMTLAALAGHGEAPEIKKSAAASKEKAPRKAKTSKTKPLKPMPESKGEAASHGISTPNDNSLGLTVRIEINLPVADNQEVYDRIFKSIRENLYP